MKKAIKQKKKWIIKTERGEILDKFYYKIAANNWIPHYRKIMRCKCYVEEDVLL